MLQDEGFEIIPGNGLGSILFGMTVSEVEEILGRAVSASVFDGGGEWTLTIHYPGLDMFFDQSDGFRLGVIELDQEYPCRLFGEPLFPRSRAGVFELLRRNLPGSEIGAIEERRNDELEEVAIDLRALWITFYFNLEDELQEVNWSTFVDANDETVWPTHAARHTK